MIKIFSNLAMGFARIAFPNVCVCCGHENTQRDRQICSFCLEGRFEDANPENNNASSDTLLPEGITFQHALWQFDKGGDLQDLLHRLKYERLTTIGVDLGRRMGQRVKEHPELNKVMQEDGIIILPVPLHYLKYRYRGFNQAFEIARGFQAVWSKIPICGIGDITRTKNTRTQTGFLLEERLNNIRNAFTINAGSVVADKSIIIIDDVFTTGATTFELAWSLQQEACGSIIILTVAQA